MVTDRLVPEGNPAAMTTPAPAAPLDRLVNAVVDRLSTILMPSVQVVPFPDRPDEYDFEGYDAAALVLYQGSRFDGAGPLGQQGMSEDVRLVVALLVRSLRGDGGAHGLIHAVCQALQGQSMAGATALRPVEFDLHGQRQDGVFQYHLTFTATLKIPPLRPSGVGIPHRFETERS